MIEGTKSMIASCIDRVSRDACGGCDRRDACRRLADMFGFGGGQWKPRPRRQASRGGGRANAFFGLLSQVSKAIEAAAGPKEPPLQREVESRIEPLLAAGTVGIDQVARAMGLSRQTLYRRLKSEGTTYEQLLDGLRRRLALKLISDEGVAVKEAAWRLGFSDPAAFSRAFKRWTGKSPSEMRPGQPG